MPTPPLDLDAIEAKAKADLAAGLVERQSTVILALIAEIRRRVLINVGDTVHRGDGDVFTFFTDGEPGSPRHDDARITEVLTAYLDGMVQR